MNLAYVSPLPPIQSGVADYGAALLPHLRPHFRRVVAVVDGYTPELPQGAVDAVYSSADEGWWLKERAVPLYHMGNHAAYHRSIFQTLQRLPGITVLHDGNLFPFVHELTLGQGDRAGFIREAAFERGRDGVTAGWDSLRRGTPLDPDEYPMLARVARASLGVVTHNRYLRDRVLQVFPDARVAVIPMLDMMPPGAGARPRGEARAALGLDPDRLLVGAFGFVAPSKQVDRALRAFARLRALFPRAQFICVGQVVPGYNLDALLGELALRDTVQVTGRVPANAFADYAQAVDVGINLRSPTWGESSATLLQLMACGVPAVVTAAGAFIELPNEVVLKAPAGPGEVEAIALALRRLLGDSTLRARMGAAALAYVERECAPAKIAQQYAAFIRSVVCASST